MVVVEVLQDVSTWDDIAETPWIDQSGYLLMRISPLHQMELDFGDAFTGYPTLPLVDLETMQVLDDDCWFGDWQDCIDDHL